MGKQTENNKNKSSKKNYSFTGHRVIGENKATHLSNGFSDSDSNTTDDMRKLLESDAPRNNQMNMMAQNPPQMPTGMGMGMNQMNPFAMNQMANANANQFMGAADIDPLMVNTLAPVNNARNDFTGFDGLMNSSQMAQNMAGIANLAQLGPNNINIANQYANNAMSETNMNGMGMGMNMNGMAMGMNNMGLNNMNMMGMTDMTNMMGMNGMGMMDNSKTLDVNGLKNLANLHSMNILKQ